LVASLVARPGLGRGHGRGLGFWLATTGNSFSKPVLRIDEKHEALRELAEPEPAPEPGVGAIDTLHV